MALSVKLAGILYSPAQSSSLCFTFHPPSVASVLSVSSQGARPLSTSPARPALSTLSNFTIISFLALAFIPSSRGQEL